MSSGKITLQSLICLAAFAAIGTAHADSPSSVRTNVGGEPSRPGSFSSQWRAKFGAGGLAEGQDESFISELKLQTIFERRFTSYFLGHFEPEVVVHAGRVQERFNTDSMEDRIGMSSGYFAVKPAREFEVRFGVIEQEYLRTPLLIHRHRGFPGAQEIAALGSDQLGLDFMAQQLVPTSHSLNLERSEKEPLPSFFVEGIRLRGEFDKWLKWGVTGGHYQWRNLPSKVAHESGLLGNSLPPDRNLGPAGARLEYGFNGGFLGFEACACGPSWLQFEMEYARQANWAAPSTRRDAQMVGGGPNFDFADARLELRYFNYFLESDTTVARYAFSNWGWTNREGGAFESELFFKKLGFRLKGHFNRASPLSENGSKASQRDFTHYYLGVETEYATF